MILIVSICKDKLHEYEFVKPVIDILREKGKEALVVHYKKLKQVEIDKAEKVVITGTSLADNDFLEPSNIESFNWLKSEKKPVLGICGGSHIIGLQLGYNKEESKEIGLKELEFDKEFLGVGPGKIQVYHLHNFQVLPEAFQKDNLYALLFHPEVRNKQMIVSFLEQ